MRQNIELHPTSCAICGITDRTTELYAANFDFDAFNPDIFSARRLPDRIHYRIARCNKCGLVRSDPIADSSLLADLYTQSHFDYGDEVSSLRRTYGYYLSILERFGVNKDAMLEIGCGNGFFLEEALEQGYCKVQGVEPSEHAIANAAPHIRPHLVCNIMRGGLFADNTFDVVCLFQVFDHIPDPGAMLDECLRVLRPGGLVLCLNHNVQAVSARLLGERSPIIDLEHTYLYCPSTMMRIFRDHGFRVKQVRSVYNNYTLRYLARLLPLPSSVKQLLLKALGITPAGALRLWVPLGNMYLIAQKPVKS